MAGNRDGAVRRTIREWGSKSRKAESRQRRATTRSDAIADQGAVYHSYVYDTPDTGGSSGSYDSGSSGSYDSGSSGCDSGSYDSGSSGCDSGGGD